MSANWYLVLAAFLLGFASCRWLSEWMYPHWEAIYQKYQKEAKRMVDAQKAFMTSSAENK